MMTTWTTLVDERMRTASAINSILCHIMDCCVLLNLSDKLNLLVNDLGIKHMQMVNLGQRTCAKFILINLLKRSWLMVVEGLFANFNWCLGLRRGWCEWEDCMWQLFLPPKTLNKTAYDSVFYGLIYQVCTMRKICLHSLKLELKQLHQRSFRLEVHELTKDFNLFSLYLNPLARRIWKWILLTGDHSFSYCLFVRIFCCIKITGFNYKL